MKISTLIQSLKSLEKKHGDIDVSFYEGSVNPDVEPEYSVHSVEILGAYKIEMSEGPRRTKNSVVLVSKYPVQPIQFNNDPASLKRKAN